MKDEGRRGVFGCLSISEAEPQICMYSVLVIITGVHNSLNMNRKTLESNMFSTSWRKRKWVKRLISSRKIIPASLT